MSGLADNAMDKRRCFVVCPIGAAGSSTRVHADWLFHEVIQHVFDRSYPNQFEIIRADKIDAPGMIDAQIIDHLLEDDLVIADMTELNPNAFYEIGIRHMKELPIIHMVRKGTDIPFDVKLFRAIPFSFDHPAELQQARADLLKALESVLSVSYKVDNPVIRARGVVKLQESTASEETIVQSQLEELKNRIVELETERGIISGANVDNSATITVAFGPSQTKPAVQRLWSAIRSFFGERLTKIAATTKQIKFELDDFEKEDADDIQSMLEKYNLKDARLHISMD